MALIGNIIWILTGAWMTALAWLVLGLLLCVTVIGIPLGTQCFKMAGLTFAPFGKVIVPGGGAPSLVANIVWLLLCGLPMALSYAVAGAVYCLTVIGIPFGLQLFKMAQLSLTPFGAQVLPA